MLRRHAELLVDDARASSTGCGRCARHGQWYLQGYPVGGEVRRRLGLVDDPRRPRRHRSASSTRALAQEPGAAALPRGHTEGPRPVALPEGWLDLVDDPTPPVGAELLVSGG